MLHHSSNLSNPHENMLVFTTEEGFLISKEKKKKRDDEIQAQVKSNQDSRNSENL